MIGKEGGRMSLFQPLADAGNIGFLLKHCLELYGGFHSHGGTPKCMVYKGKSQSKMDDLGVPPFRVSGAEDWRQPLAMLSMPCTCQATRADLGVFGHGDAPQTAISICWDNVVHEMRNHWIWIILGMP